MSLAVHVRARSLTARVALRARSALAFGSGEEASVVGPAELGLAPLHFAIEAGEESASVRDLGGGILVDGEPAEEAALRNGSTITAGDVVFEIRHEPGAPAFDGAPVLPAGLESRVHVSAWTATDASDRRGLVARILSSQPEPLYALLDAAREPAVLSILRASGEPYTCLFPGEPGVRMAGSAPYLVRLREESSLVSSLVEKGWGRSWGVYLTSRHPIEKLLLCLQYLLLVQDDDGQAMYFRYYDPRVLRTFLPVTTERQADVFFAATSAFLFEGGKRRTLLRMTRIGAGEP